MNKSTAPSTRVILYDNKLYCGRLMWFSIIFMYTSYNISCDFFLLLFTEYENINDTTSQQQCTFAGRSLYPSRLIAARQIDECVISL